MTRINVYLDLDRTLFNTNEVEVLWQYIAKYFDVDEDAMFRQADRYYVTSSEANYYHDLGRQLTDLGLDPQEVYRTLEKTDLANDRFLFDGAKELVEWLSQYAQPSIITYGEDDYQRFKVALCPSLAGLFVVTTDKPKSEILHTLPHDGAWLVDDKPIGDELPEGMKFVQVSLEGKPVEKQDWPVFENLRDVQSYFRSSIR